MPDSPPSGHPPIVLEQNYRASKLEQVEHYSPEVSLQKQQLHLVSSSPMGNVGWPVGGTTFRDCIVQAQISLLSGGEEDLYGIFFRQASVNLYYCYAMSLAGQVVVSMFDGAYRDVVNGNLAPDMKFNKGLNQPNLFQFVACGPCISLILNGMVVTGIIVDPRFKEGYLGFYLHHGNASPQAEIGVDWIQVRGLFPE